MAKKRKKTNTRKAQKPAQSKQKKTTGPKVIFPKGELEADHLQNLKGSLDNQYNSELSTMLNMMFSLQEMIGAKLQELHAKKEKVSEKDVMNMPKEEIQRLYRTHVQIDRSVMIEQVVMFDSFIEQALHNYQNLKLKDDPKEISNFEKTEDGLDECLKGKQLSKEFKDGRENIKNFRMLKDQLARYPNGAFIFPAAQKGFETFLKSLEGIEIRDTIGCKINDKAGNILPYHIHSGSYIDKFYHDSKKFYAMLLDILFPSEDGKGKKKAAPKKGNSTNGLTRVN